MKRVLPLLIQTAGGARDREAASLAQAQLALGQAAATLQQLGDFRADCLASSAGGTLGHSNGASLQAYQGFVDRLDEAIAQQEQALRLREQQAGVQQGRLQQAQQRLFAFETLRRREDAAGAAKAQRREQREADEYGARAFQRLAVGGTP